MKWKTVLLGKHCSKIGSGATPKGGASVYIENGTAFIRSQNVYNLFFAYDGLVFIDDDASRKLNNVTIQKDDILLNITGDSVARTCMVPNGILPARVNQHVAIIRPYRESFLPKFLSYYLASPYMQAYMLNLAVGKGASRNALSKEIIERFPIPKPSIPEQIRFIELLNPFDELIETNQKQIKLLEEAAQRLYKEWFIDLRFPGHETTPIINGIPEGWTKTNIDCLCELLKTSIVPDEIESNTPYIGLEHMPRKDFCLSTWDDSSSISSNKYCFKRRNILFGKIRPYFHKVGFAITDGVASTDSFVFEPKQEIWGLFLLTVSSDAFVNYAYKTCKEGAKMPRADWNQMKEYPLLVAKESIQKQFEKNISKMTKQIEVLAIQNHKLMEARDRLLPKLMSGEIEV